MHCHRNHLQKGHAPAVLIFPGLRLLSWTQRNAGVVSSATAAAALHAKGMTEMWAGILDSDAVQLTEILLPTFATRTECVQRS